MTRIAIIVGSTRPNRIGRNVVEWVHRIASKRAEATYEIVDLAEYDLPLYDEEIPAAVGQYARAHTKRWAETVGSFDGFLVVTPEYNHAPSAAVKNAFDFVYAEWRDKAIGTLTDDEFQPATAEVVEGRVVLGHPDRVERREQRHAGEQPDGCGQC